MSPPTAAPARALTKSSPYNGPRGQPGPHETNPTPASSRNTGSRTPPRDPTNTSGAAQRASNGRGGGGGGGRRNSGSQPNARHWAPAPAARAPAPPDVRWRRKTADAVVC